MNLTMMFTHFAPTAGTLMFLGGAVLTAATVIAGIVILCTAGGRKRRILEQMKQTY